MRRANGSIAPWSFVNGNQAVEVIVSGPFIANDMPTVLGAAVKGLGLAQAPAPVVAGAVKAGSLVGLLQPFTSMAPGLFLYYPGHRQTPPKAACLHRSREGPPGLRQQNRHWHCWQASRTAQKGLMLRVMGQMPPVR